MARYTGPVLHDILETIALIDTALAGKSREDFGKDDILRLAIPAGHRDHLEASRHIPDELLLHAPQIPWRAIRGIGNVLRHEYHSVADDIIWNVVVRDLPALRAAVESLISHTE